MKLGFVHDIDEDNITNSVYDENEKQQVEKWVKELAHFLKDNSKSTSDDDSENDESGDDNDDDEADSDVGSQWEEYDPDAY